MVNRITKLIRAQLDRLFPLLSELPWKDIFSSAWKLVKKSLSNVETEGLYEVLEYESILELLDTKGRKARFSKRERVRYLQDNIIAYQDHAWGDGKILLNYRCTPGKLVDRYQLGHKIFLLISLRESKERGESDEFNMEWRMLDSFLSAHESWETEVRHNTKKVKVQIVFPKSRPPHRFWLETIVRAKRTDIDKGALRQLPDENYQLTWQMNNLRLNERYQVHWTW